MSATAPPIGKTPTIARPANEGSPHNGTADRFLKPPIELQIGDTLLYGPSDLFGVITCLKTFGRACHVEIYAGNGKSIASRNGIGVNIYDLRLKQLIAVRRPIVPINFERGMWWFERHAKGQGYDWLGLFCFFIATWQGSKRKMFCSEFWKRFYPWCGLDVMAPDWDADRTSPAQCLQTPALTTVWSATASKSQRVSLWKFLLRIFSVGTSRI